MLPVNEQRCTLQEIADWQKRSVYTIRAWVRRGLEIERDGPRGNIRTTREAVVRFLAPPEEPYRYSAARAARVDPEMLQRVLRNYGGKRERKAKK